MFKTKTRDFLSVFILLCGVFAQASHPVLIGEKGTWMVQGQVSLPLEYNYLRQTVVRIKMDPQVGQFVIPFLWVGGGLGITGAYGAGHTLYDSSSNERDGLNWRLKGGVQYFFDMNSRWYPFVGGNLFVEMNDFTLVSIKWGLEIPIGVMFALNEHVGLTFGIPLEFGFKATSLFEKMVASPGCFGIVAFF